jgi:hypothetical protein
MMAQGGFSRDQLRAAILKKEATARKDKEEREKIGNEIIVKLNPYFEDKINNIEKGLILKQDETIAEFIEMMRSRNRLLKFLLWTNVITLFSLSFVLGYFL